MMRTPFVPIEPPTYIEVGGARVAIRALTLQFDLAGEIVAIEVCLTSPPELQRHSLESALRLGADIHLAVHGGAVGLSYVGYQLVASLIDGSVICYTLAGGQYALDGVQLRQGQLRQRHPGLG